METEKYGQWDDTPLLQTEHPDDAVFGKHAPFQELGGGGGTYPSPRMKAV